MEIGFRQLIHALRRWAWLITLATLFAGALVYLIASQQPPMYSATTTLLVNPQQASGIADGASLAASQALAQTYVLLVESGPVLENVIIALGLPYTREELAQKTRAAVVPGTQLIEIMATDPSPEDAARIAGGVAEQFEAQVENLTIGRLEENLSELQEEANSLQSRQRQIDDRLSALSADEPVDNSADQREIDDLTEERTRNAETLADLDASIRSINEGLATTTSPLTVADEAQAAREPNSPRIVLLTALGLCLGFLTGVCIAALFEFLDNKIRLETDLEALSGSRVLAVVPYCSGARLRRAPLYPVSEDTFTDSVYRLAIRLHSEVCQEGQKRIVFTSAGGDVATSELVAHLGIVLAQSGLRTTIVDANLREPKQRQIFAIGNQIDTWSVLTSPQDGELVPGVVVRDNLTVIPAGVPHGSPYRLLSSLQFASILKRVGEDSDVVLIDVPPAPAYSDAMRVASNCDAIILVGRVDVTSKDDLLASSDMVAQVNVQLLGIVLEH